MKPDRKQIDRELSVLPAAPVAAPKATESQGWKKGVSPDLAVPFVSLLMSGLTGSSETQSEREPQNLPHAQTRDGYSSAVKA